MTKIKKGDIVELSAQQGECYTVIWIRPSGNVDLFCKETHQHMTNIKPRELKILPSWQEQRLQINSVISILRDAQQGQCTSEHAVESALLTLLGNQSL